MLSHVRQSLTVQEQSTPGCSGYTRTSMGGFIYNKHFIQSFVRHDGNQLRRENKRGQRRHLGRGKISTAQPELNYTIM